MVITHSNVSAFAKKNSHVGKNFVQKVLLMK